MARSIWSGVITFGMVSIPVGLQSATQEKDIHFHQIHKTCGSRIRYHKWCPVDKRVVEDDEIVKGYEVSKGRYVLLEPADFEDLPVPTAHAIEVIAFVHREQIDPIYYDKTYLLEPEEAGVKPYALMRQALKAKGVDALAKIALRSKESLCVVRPGDAGLMLETLFYPDEIRQPEQAPKDVKVDERELKMAISLVELLQEDFEPQKYHDAYRDALMERIREKSEGHTVQPQEPAPAQPGKVIDLMEALKASVDAAKKGRKAG